MASNLQQLLVVFLITLLPGSLFAKTFVMLSSVGHTTVNKSKSPSSIALFEGDLVDTAQDSAATINAQGTMVLIQADSSVRFTADAVNMSHGGVLVTTSKAMAVRAGKFTISPVASESTKFEVSDSGGVIQIAARQGSVNISDGTRTTLLAEGQETTRNESGTADADKREPGAPTSGRGGFHVSKKTAAILISGAAAGTTVGVLLATQGSHPVSPAIP